MYVVAIAELDRSLEEEETAIASILGVSPYDVRLALHATPPSVVLRTPSREHAEGVLAALRLRRCAALLVDLAEVVPTGRMVAVRRFSIDDEGITANGGSVKQPWDALAAILRVATTTNVEHTAKERDVRTTGRGGAVQVVVERTHLEREHEQRLYLFWRSGSVGVVPWVLHLREARYLGLGSALKATTHENFFATIVELRRRAPTALFDDRFGLHALTRQVTVQVRGDVRSADHLADAGIDLPVHLLARWLLEPSNDPYRDGRA